MKKNYGKKFLSNLITALIMGLVANNALATNIAIGGIVAGGGLFHKPVKSMRELRYKNMVHQTLDYSCGAAALATLLNYGFNMKLTEKEILVETTLVDKEKQLYKNGMSLLDMQKFVAKKGLQAKGFKVKAINLKKLKVPAIILLDLNGYKHFVVLKMVRGNKVHIADPALGNKVLTMKQFEKSWNNILMIVVGNNYNKANPLQKISKKLSAKPLFGPNDAAIHVPPLEFGGAHAKYF